MSADLSEGLVQGERGRIIRIAVFFDARSMPVHSMSAGALDRAVSGMVSEWIQRPEFAEVVTRIKRVYAGHHMLPLALMLGRRMGWRQGGNGEQDAIGGFIVNDSKAFCMEAPSRSAVVVLSEDAGLAGVIAEIREAGSEVYLITKDANAANDLTSGVKIGNIGVLPSKG